MKALIYEKFGAVFINVALCARHGYLCRRLEGRCLLPEELKLHDGVVLGTRQ